VADFILSAEGISKKYGAFSALTNVSLKLKSGEIRAVIGPNGAGKSTLTNVLGGQILPTAGTVVLDGRIVTGLAPHRRAGLGIGRTFQINSTFRHMTVRENMLAACVAAAGTGYSLFSSKLRVLDSRVAELVDEVGLSNISESIVEAISHGDRKRLELGMVLATGPRLLLLDEPTAGMGLNERQDLFKLIVDVVKKRGLTLMFVEHDIDIVFNLAERITVMARGSVLAEGNPDEISADPHVQEIYLGESVAAKGATC
jgi:branched-chain amino acid transport system ATP-binding protein